MNATVAAQAASIALDAREAKYAKRKLINRIAYVGTQHILTKKVQECLWRNSTPT